MVNASTPRMPGQRTRSRMADGLAMASVTGACVGFASWILVGPAPDDAGWESIRRASLPPLHASSVWQEREHAPRAPASGCQGYELAPPAGCDPTASAASPVASKASASRRTREAGSETRNVLPSPGRLSMPSSAW